MYRKAPFWEKGQGAVEYALGLSLIAVVLILVLGALYSVMVDQFRGVICDGDMNIECTIGLPVANIQRTCDGVDCTFDGTNSTDSSGSIVTYEWDFGDGTTGAGSIANNIYSSDGTYTVILVVTDDEGHTDSAAITISVSALNQPPTASFTVTCTQLNCSFDGTASDDSDGTIVSYTWDFGDGASGSGETTNHTYSSSGSRTVRLTVVDDYGSSVSTTRSATPTAPPASVGHVSDLNATATVGATTWTATVNITVENALNVAVNGATVSGNFTNGGGLGNCTTNASGVCTITSNAIPVASVSNLTFTVSGISGPVSYNAAANVRTSVTVSHTPNPPTANFTVSCSALVCTFNASSSGEGNGGPIISYSWDFGDGSTGTGVSTSRTYASVGTYTVELTVTDNSGATASHTGFASPAPNVAPTASFTVNCNALVCSVDASASSDSDGTINTYSWNFGDGSTGSGVSTSRTYAAVGTYTITLNILDNSGATASTTRSVSPTNTPSEVHISDLDATTTSSGGNWTTTVTITVKDAADFAFNGATITGSFDNGGGSNLPCMTVTGGTCTITSNPVPRTGGSAVTSLTFTVSSVTGSLTYNSAANNDTDGDSNGTTITVAAPANAAPTASFTVSCANLVCSVNASASSDSDGTISTYSWNFGDSSTGTGVTTSRTYAAAGTFTITLTVTDNLGATGTTTRTATPSAANAAPTASFTVSCANLVCSVDASASSDSDGTISTYSWNFGDSSTATGMTASRTYTAAGTYTITLTVTDNLGATGTTTRTATPTNPGIVTHIADLASATASTGNDWTATITITVQNASNAAVNGATVTGSFNNGGGSNLTCTTSPSGTCTITSAAVRRTGGTAIASLTFTVSNVSGTSMTYNSAANVESSITVNKP